MKKNRKKLLWLVTAFVSLIGLFLGQQIFSFASTDSTSKLKAKNGLVAKEVASSTVNSTQESSRESVSHVSSEVSSSQAATIETTETITSEEIEVISETSQEKNTPIEKVETVEEIVPEVSKKNEPKLAPNSIGVNGIYKPFHSLGAETNLGVIQGAIDAGWIVTTISTFNPRDNQTTYFGGPNPGIMNFMEENIQTGAIVTVVDSNGTSYDYQAVDHAVVDQYGEAMLNTIGMRVIDLYSNGSNQESIAIQYCLSNSELMIMWYLVPFF